MASTLGIIVWYPCLVWGINIGIFRNLQSHYCFRQSNDLYIAELFILQWRIDCCALHHLPVPKNPCLVSHFGFQGQHNTQQICYLDLFIQQLVRLPVLSWIREEYLWTYIIYYLLNHIFQPTNAFNHITVFHSKKCAAMGFTCMGFAYHYTINDKRLN